MSSEHTYTFAMEPLRVSTMTICSKWSGDDSAMRSLDQFVDAIPTTLHDDQFAEGSAPCRRVTSRKGDMLFIRSGAQWRGSDIEITIRAACCRGKKGSGTVVCGNFRNCVPLTCGKQGVKVFRSGALQAWGFKDIDSFHEFASAALEILGKATLQIEETRISLAIYDSCLVSTPTLHLRAYAQECVSRAEAGEEVEYTPEEFAGVKIKLPHPIAGPAKVSVNVRAKGSVKLYLGRCGQEHERALQIVLQRVKRILAC